MDACDRKDGMNKLTDLPIGNLEEIRKTTPDQGHQAAPAPAHAGDLLKAVMRDVASPVVILSTGTAAGERHAMTVSSFTSVSLEPPSILACVKTASSIHEPISRLKQFCVNVLEPQQQHLADQCARSPSLQRFAGGGWCFTDEGLPFLPDARAVLWCELASATPMGTHAVLLAQVHRVTHGSQGAVLTYRNGNYLTL